VTAPLFAGAVDVGLARDVPTRSSTDVETARLALTYVLPLRTDGREPPTELLELADYLRELAHHVDDVVVVDGSAPEVVDRHREVFGPLVRVMVPETRTPMGKVGNVITGVHRARHEFVVVADDDVRYEAPDLQRLRDLLATAEVVRPQNYFRPLPWHARFETARILLNRCAGGDWPGTLALRRSAFVASGAYAGDVMFENLELVRTIQAVGGRERVALDVLVARRPPTTAHFRRQQVREAYDEFARPIRLVVSLLYGPALLAALALRRRSAVVATAAVVTLGAEAGRRRAGGRAVFPASSSLLAFPWSVWRSACSWAAVGARLRGGVRYRDVRLRRAASSRRALRRAARV
jgi:hypothetical protein